MTLGSRWIYTVLLCLDVDVGKDLAELEWPSLLQMFCSLHTSRVLYLFSIVDPFFLLHFRYLKISKYHIFWHTIACTMKLYSMSKWILIIVKATSCARKRGWGQASSTQERHTKLLLWLYWGSALVVFITLPNGQGMNRITGGIWTPPLLNYLVSKIITRKATPQGKDRISNQCDSEHRNKLISLPLPLQRKADFSFIHAERRHFRQTLSH